MPTDPRSTRPGSRGLAGEPHRRYNPLVDEWVLVSAGRTRRPWLGRRGARGGARPARPIDPDCYLCPGNTRANGHVNPALRRRRSSSPTTSRRSGRRRRWPSSTTASCGPRASAGTCRVVCFSPRHDLTLGADGAGGRPARDRRLGRADRGARRRLSLGPGLREPRRGDGRLEPASRTARSGRGPRSPARPRARTQPSGATSSETGRRLLLDYVDHESGGQRVVEENDDWLVVVPFWAIWPFETLVIPKRPAARLDELDGDRPRRAGRRAAGAASAATTACSSGRSRTRWAGTRRRSAATRPTHWQVHAHFYPPLLRATVRKFMVGYELLAETQRDLTAEDAADRLRAVVPAVSRHRSGPGRRGRDRRPIDADILDPDRLRDRLRAARSGRGGGDARAVRCGSSARRAASTSSASTPTTTTASRCRRRSGSRSGSRSSRRTIVASRSRSTSTGETASFDLDAIGPADRAPGSTTRPGPPGR